MQPDPDREVVTLDTNALNRHFPADELRNLIAGKTICVSDLVVAETINSPDSHKWALDCFARLYGYERHVFCTNSLPHYMHLELETGQPTRCATANSIATDNVRRLIRECARAPVEARKVLARVVPDTVANMQERQRMLHSGAAQAEEACRDVLDNIGLDEARRIAEDVTLFPQFLADVNFVLFVGRLIDLTPKTGSVDAEYLARSHAIWARYYYAVFAYMIKAHDQPGMTQQRPRRIMNDHNDSDIVIVGSYTTRTVTADPMGQYVDRAVRLCVQQLLQLTPRNSQA